MEPLWAGQAVEPAVRGVLAAAGVTAGAASVVPGRVHRRPGAETSAAFAVATGGREWLVWLTDADVPAPWAGHGLRGWTHPHDPVLPALRLALDPDAAARWLPGVAGPVTATQLSYRPLRRAVVALTDASGRRFFAKLWEPARAADLVLRHRILDDAGLGPRIVAEPEPGVLVVADADGVSLARRLAEHSASGAALPEPAEVLRLLDRLPAELLALRPRAAWSDHGDFHGATAAAALPGRAGEIDDLVGRLTALLAGLPEPEPVPTHGDFHEANVFAAGPVFTSVIDVDTAGPGRRVDDLACLLGHLVVLPGLSPAHYANLGPVVAEWGNAFERGVDPAALRARTAGVLLSLVGSASGERAEARLAASVEWLGAAEAARAHPGG